VTTDLLAALDHAAPGAASTRASDRHALAHDASHYLLVPEAVVWAGDAEQVAAVVRACAELGRAVTFRSGGTSLSGQSGTDGVLVDTRRHFREVTVLDGGTRVRVQPGITIQSVNARLAPYGTRLGPDPASLAACTVGGMVANNSSGMACGTELNTYNTLESMLLVLPSGTVVDTGAPDARQALAATEPELYRGLLRLRDRVRSDGASMRTIRLQFAIKNTMGYGVNAFVDYDEPTDILAHLLVGSEGTLGFVAEATFRTVPVKPLAATGLVVFDNLRLATAALPQLVADGLATIELLDATSLRVSQVGRGAPAELAELAVHEHAALLIEHQDTDEAVLAERVRDTRELLAGLRLTASPRLTREASERSALWRLRKDLYATVAGSRPRGTTALLEDVAVPPEALAELCGGLTELFARHGYRDSVIFGHAKDGNVHFLLNERFEAEGGVGRYLAFTDDLVDLVLGAGGTLKAEHGTGRIMAPYVERQFGAELYDVMVEVKRLCDPAGVLNPGVVISSDNRIHVSHLKPAVATGDDEVDRCVECGYCEPVCPSADLTLTPRTRIVLRREIATARERGETPLADELESDYGYDGLDTCAADGMCRTACPVLIDTGSLVSRLRGERQARAASRAWTLAARHWGAVTRAGSSALTTARRVPPAMPSAVTAAGRRVLGPETVPAWTPDLPYGGTRRSQIPYADDLAVEAVHFPACLDAMFGADPGAPPGGPTSLGAAAAFAALCGRAGVGLRAPGSIDALCCGTPWKSKGHAKGYAEMSARVVPSLRRATDGGRLPVVCESASCAEGLQVMVASEAPEIMVVDAVSFTVDVLLDRLPPPDRVRSAVVHPTCSTRRAGTDPALAAVAGVLAEEVVVPTEWRCCAFAGDRGMLHPELTASATEREAAQVVAAGHDLHLSVNRTCELGLSRATGRHYEHVLEALERATKPVTDSRASL
jgi:D-lactate dehydrogenase